MLAPEAVLAEGNLPICGSPSTSLVGPPSGRRGRLAERQLALRRSLTPTAISTGRARRSGSNFRDLRSQASTQVSPMRSRVGSRLRFSGLASALPQFVQPRPAAAATAAATTPSTAAAGRRRSSRGLARPLEHEGRMRGRGRLHETHRRLRSSRGRSRLSVGPVPAAREARPRATNRLSLPRGSGTLTVGPVPSALSARSPQTRNASILPTLVSFNVSESGTGLRSARLDAIRDRVRQRCRPRFCG